MNILNWFKKKQPIDTNNKLVFEIKKDGNLVIDVNLNDNSLEAQEYLGRVLFELNNGNYAQSMMNLLLEIGKKDTSYSFMVNKSINVWYSHIINKEDKPIISPSQFNRNDKH